MCVIYRDFDYSDPASNEPFVVGETFCSKADQFSRYLGRAYALKDALDDAELSDDERQLIRSAYLDFVRADQYREVRAVLYGHEALVQTKEEVVKEQ